MKPVAPFLCIYHGNCADGFTAAWVVRRALGNQVECLPAGYGKAPPDVTGRAVILVDFSYPRATLLAMAETATRVIVLDHHKSAQADLEGLDHPKIETVFDMERSGARIAWDFYFPDEAPPPLLLRVEDRDLWRFALTGTRQIQAALFSHPYDFGTWDALMADETMTCLYNDGQAIERKHHKDIDELLKVSTRAMNIGGHVVPVANLPYTMASDAGALLSEGMPFAATYYDTADARVFSLRSDKNGLDVSEVAKAYGGGGHKHAAGFRVSLHKAWEMEGFVPCTLETRADAGEASCN